MKCSSAADMGEKIKDTMAKTSEALVEYREKTKEKVLELKNQTVEIVKDPEFQSITISTTTGTIIIGTIGGAFGLASGIATGTLAGFPPALLTFGMSIPAGAVLGGGAGSAIGIGAGASVGAAAGYGTYKYRLEIKDGLVYVKAKVTDKAQHGKLLVLDTATAARLKVSSAVGGTKTKADDLITFVRT